MPYVDDLGLHLSQFAWEGIVFPGDDISTTFGHDSARHSAFGQRGANIETTGPKAETVKVRAVLMNGLRGWTGLPLFPDTYNRLMRALKGSPEGLLSHPTRGDFKAHFDDGTEEIRPKERRGLYLTLTFTEQNGDADLLAFAPTMDPGAAMAASAAEADDARPTAALDQTSLATEVTDATGFLEESTRGYGEATARLEALVDSIAARRFDPAAAGVDAHAYRAALAATQVATLRYRDRYLGAGRRTFVVPEESSLARLAAHPLVYGDASRLGDLARANTVLDPSRVPAGTLLVVVD